MGYQLHTINMCHPFHLLYTTLVLTLAVAAAATAVSYRPGIFSQIFAFGDSFTDTGNTRSSTGPSSFGHVSSLPYGMTFFHHPTNRYSDGRLVVDFLASTLSLPFLPPYLHPSSSNNFSNGVNFAVAGSTAIDHRFFSDNITLDITPQSLHTQLTWFNQHLKESGELDEEALFWVGEIGANDYAYSLGSTIPPSTILDLSIRSITSFLEDLLAGAGAKYLVVQGLPLTGCLPFSMLLSLPEDRDDLHCSAYINDLVSAHNARLQETLKELRNRHPEAIISYADYAGAHRAIMKNPSRYGFEETMRACCGSGGGPYNFNIFATCGDPGATQACPHPEKFVNWDGVHFTEATYKSVAEMFFSHGYCSPSFDVLLHAKNHE